MKNLFVNNVVLRILNLNERLLVNVDGSRKGIAGCISQYDQNLNQNSVAFFSK